MRHYPEENTYVEVKSGEWEEAAVVLIAVFLGGGILLIGWGVWDLLSSDAAQSAVAAAIRYIGYGLTVLLVLLGLGGLAYGASFFVKSAAPLNLSKGVQENGGLFRTDGIVVVLPKDFHKLPPNAQRSIVAGLINAGHEEKRQLPTGKGPEVSNDDAWINVTTARG